MTEKVNIEQISGTEIDDILNEIDDNELKNDLKISSQDKSAQKHNEYSNNNWNEIMDAVHNVKLNYIKTLITSNELAMNEGNPENGQTLLMIAVIIGNLELVQTIINFGVDVNVKDDEGKDALDYAMIYGRYKITELIFYQTLQGSLGNDLKNIAIQLHSKMEQSKSAPFNKWTLEEAILPRLQNRNHISQDLLFWAWYGEAYLDREYDGPFASDLWKSMMDTFEEILVDTSSTAGWTWLKSDFLPSLIWYLPHPEYEEKQKSKEEKDEKYDVDEDDEEDDGDDMENILRKTLFYEILKRVRAETKKQSDLLLKPKIEKVKSEKPTEWNLLTQFNINTKYSKNARQDICGCLIPKYTEHDLSNDIYPASIHFSAKKHYDSNIYLNELLFKGNILDDMFQNDMMIITKEISTEIGKDISFKSGPVKTLIRSQAKVENDYINEDYPTSARILDINRCSLGFENIAQMMKCIDIFIKKVENGKARSIKEIIRCKNGWSVYDPQSPQYTDIKLNILIESEKNGSIIAEIQFLLDLMSDFKKVAHKLYAVERKFEMVYNFGLLRKKMQTFKDIDGLHNILKDLIETDDLKHFQLIWNYINMEDEGVQLICSDKRQHGVSHIAFFIMMKKNGAINQYMQQECGDFYLKVLSQNIQIYCLNDPNQSKQYYGSMPYRHTALLKDLDEYWSVTEFMKQILDVINMKNTAKRREILNTMLSYTEYENNPISFRTAIYKHGGGAETMLMEIDNERKYILKLLTKNSNEFFHDIMISNRYVNAMEFICYKSKLTADDKWQLVKKEMETAGKIAVVLMNYYKNEPKKLLQLLKMNNNALINCMLKSDEHSNALKCILYDSKIGNKDIKKFVDVAIKKGILTGYTSAEFINYYKTNTKYLSKILTSNKNALFEKILTSNQNLEQLKVLLYKTEIKPKHLQKLIMETCNSTKDIDDEIAAEIFKYFQNDSEFTLKLLNIAILFDQLLENKNHLKSLQIVFYESKLPSKGDIIWKLLKTRLQKKNEIDNDIFVELMRFYKNNKNNLLSLYWHTFPRNIERYSVRKKHYIADDGEFNGEIILLEWLIWIGDYKNITSMLNIIVALTIKDDKFLESDNMMLLFKASCLVNHHIVISNILNYIGNNDDKKIKVLSQDMIERKEEPRRFYKYNLLSFSCSKGYYESAKVILTDETLSKHNKEQLINSQISEKLETTDCESECGGCWWIEHKGDKGNAVDFANQGGYNNISQLIASI